jgi:hypothetical protein
MSDSQLQKRAEELASADIELSDGEIIEGVARNVAHDLEEFEIEEE